MPPEPSHWKIALLLASVTFLSCIYFYEGGGWNQNSRFDLLRAILERHTLPIDVYVQNTQDRAYFQGHYYSDKAPGLVFFSLPFAAVARPALRVVGINPEAPRGAFALSYIACAAGAALPAALSAMGLFFLSLRLGASSTAAAFGTLAMALGTPLWAYGTIFWAHCLAGACLLFAFAFALKLRGSQTARSDFLLGLAIGLAAGWAVVTEYPAAPASALLALLALSQVWPRGAAARWRVAFGLGVPSTLCLVVLLSYLYAEFGRFTPGYQYLDSTQFTFMQQRGYLGLTYPHPDRLLKLLFGGSRGLFFASPVLLAAPVGLWHLWKQKAHSAAALVAAAIASYYFLFNSSFYWWKSGLSFGPRYAGASFPLLCLGLAVAWQHLTPAWRRVLHALAAVSIFFALIAVSTTSELPMQDSNPIFHVAWPSFWHGELAFNRVSMLTVAEAGSNGQYTAFNLGQLLGLHGLASLLPLFAVWIVAAILWVRVDRRPA